jgi:hypothetical protein
MSIQEVKPETLAELFHHYHQALSPESRPSSRPPCETWNDVPAPERNRLVAAARLALLELATTAREQEESKRYFAKAGEAEWGC